MIYLLPVQPPLVTIQPDTQTYYDQHVLEHAEQKRMAWINRRNQRAITAHNRRTGSR